MTTQVQVYLDDGRVFEYGVKSASSGREHASAIVQTGYRSTVDGVMEHYPPHRITKVKVLGGVTTKYSDRVRGT
jgi:hypothetical protein